MIELLDIVILKTDDPKTGIKAGTEGTIVDILGNGKAFTVEFFDEDGNTYRGITLYGVYSRAITKGRNNPDPRGMLVFFCHDTNNLLNKNLGHAARLAHIGTQRKRCLHTKTPPMSC